MTEKNGLMRSEGVGEKEKGRKERAKRGFFSLNDHLLWPLINAYVIALSCSGDEFDAGFRFNVPHRPDNFALHVPERRVNCIWNLAIGPSAEIIIDRVLFGLFLLLDLTWSLLAALMRSCSRQFASSIKRTLSLSTPWGIIKHFLSARVWAPSGSTTFTSTRTTTSDSLIHISVCEWKRRKNILNTQYIKWIKDLPCDLRSLSNHPLFLPPHPPLAHRKLRCRPPLSANDVHRGRLNPLLKVPFLLQNVNFQRRQRGKRKINFRATLLKGSPFVI